MMYHGLCYHRKFHSYKIYCRLENNSELFSLQGVDWDGKYYGYEECTFEQLKRDYIVIPWGKCTNPGGGKYYFYMCNNKAFVSHSLNHFSRITKEDVDPSNWAVITKDMFERTYSIEIEPEECIEKETDEWNQYYFDFLNQEYVVENTKRRKKYWPDQFENQFEVDAEKVVTKHCVDELSDSINKEILKEVEKMWNGDIIKIGENKLR